MYLIYDKINAFGDFSPIYRTVESKEAHNTYYVLCNVYGEDRYFMILPNGEKFVR